MENNLIKPITGNVEIFLKNKCIWLIVCFILSADIFCSINLKQPLLKLSAESLYEDCPIGAAMFFLAVLV